MTHDKDKILIRAKDITMIVSIITLLGLVLSPVKKIFKFDDAVEKIAKLEDRMMINEREIATIDAHYADISKQLDQISWKLQRIRDDRR